MESGSFVKNYNAGDFSRTHNLFPELPVVRGYIEATVPTPNGGIDVRGWALLPDTPLSELEVYLDGLLVATAPFADRPDVAAAISWVPHAGRSGYSFRVDNGSRYGLPIQRLDLIGCHEGTRRSRLSQFIRFDIDQMNTPPEEYMFRVVHTKNPHFFKVGSLKTFGEFMEVLTHCIDFSALTRVLDWGCGCGRLVNHFMAIRPDLEIIGCDIDPFAVEWSNKTYRTDAFSKVQPLPPTSYREGEFDLVYSYSVLTHLTRSAQEAWLREIFRITRPGGFFLATTHGDFALQFAQQTCHPSWPSDGIIDSTIDDTLAGIAPKDYYRATYQRENFTRRLFSTFFDVITYIARGATNFQDLILAQRRK